MTPHSWAKPAATARTTETLLLVSFGYQGPGDPYQEMVNRLAGTVANTPGIIWKTWFVNEDERQAGSLHLFHDAGALEAYVRGAVLTVLEQDEAVVDLTVKRYSTLNEIPLIAIRRWQQTSQAQGEV